jgi:hypothetical protein
MPPIQGRTRSETRLSVGRNLNAVRQTTAIAGGSTITFLTNGLFGGTDNHNGKWLLGTGPVNNLGTQFRVTDSSFAAPTTTLTFYPAGTSVAAADTAELWDGKYEPTYINEFINQAITEVTGLAYDPEESLALHGDGRQRRFDIPSEFVMLNGIYRRTSVTGIQIHDATTEWDEAAVPTNITRVVDTKDYKKVPASNKFSIAGAFSTGLVSSKAITSLDLSGYDYMEFWIKSTVATGATTLTLLLDNTTACASALETLAIPALTADTWTFVRVALANPELDTAIISVGLNVAVDYGATAGYVWINDVMAVKDETAVWTKVDDNSWHVDEEARDIIFRSAPDYKLLKLTGGDKPLLFTADSDVCEVDDKFVIARATQLALLSTGEEALRPLAGYWENRANEAKRGMPWLVGARTVG